MNLIPEPLRHPRQKWDARQERKKLEDVNARIDKAVHEIVKHANRAFTRDSKNLTKTFRFDRDEDGIETADYPPVTLSSGAVMKMQKKSRSVQGGTRQHAFFIEVERTNAPRFVQKMQLEIDHNGHLHKLHVTDRSSPDPRPFNRLDRTEAESVLEGLKKVDEAVGAQAKIVDDQLKREIESRQKGLKDGIRGIFS